MRKVLFIAEGLTSFNRCKPELQASRIQLYKRELKPFMEENYTIEYFANDPVAKIILDSIEYENKVAVGVIPKAELDIWSKWFNDDYELIPEHYIDTVQQNYEILSDKYSYPRATSFKVKDEYLQARKSAMRRNIRVACTNYASKQYMILQFGQAHFIEKLIGLTFEGDGKIIISIEMEAGCRNCTYGGHWVDYDTMKAIIKAEGM